MKSGIQERLPSRDVRPYSAGVASDYLITTMKLRDQVFASKPPKPKLNCKLIRNMRSAPPFQNRNLDNYPMPHNREDAVRSARGHRADRVRTAIRTSRSRVDSGYMRDYSKQMFDFTVRNAKNNGIYHKDSVRSHDYTNSVRSQSETDYYVALRTNGPTPDGSALHNRRQKVLNSIRIRPHTECQTRFVHERSASCSNVQHAISDKNLHYRVRNVTESSARPGSNIGNISVAGSEFIFIPVDQSSPMNEWVSNERVNSRRITFNGSLSESDEIDSLEATFGKDPFDEVDDRAITDTFENTPDDDKPKHASPYTAFSRTLLPPDVSRNLRLVSLDDPSSSESEEEKPEPEVEVKKPEPPPPPPPQPKSRARKKVPEPEPAPEPVKVKLILKGPHCWVDDATITSEPSDNEETEGQDEDKPTPVEQQDVDKHASAQKLDMTSKTKLLMKGAISANTKPSLSGAILKLPNQQAMKDAFNKALEKNEPEQANATENNNANEPTNDAKETDKDRKNDDKNDVTKETKGEIYLPPFLCPSSEKKSREAALKDWLANTCFRTGHKGIPVV